MLFWSLRGQMQVGQQSEMQVTDVEMKCRRTREDSWAISTKVAFLQNLGSSLLELSETKWPWNYTNQN